MNGQCSQLTASDCLTKIKVSQTWDDWDSEKTKTFEYLYSMAIIAMAMAMALLCFGCEPHFSSLLSPFNSLIFDRVVSMDGLTKKIHS